MEPSKTNFEVQSITRDSHEKGLEVDYARSETCPLHDTYEFVPINYMLTKVLIMVVF